MQWRGHTYDECLCLSVFVCLLGVDSKLLQISAFFLFSNVRKRQIALYSPCWLVGRLVSRLVDVTINFSIYTGIKALN